MVDVRKILTQILLEVTNEEIQKAVDEEIKHFKRKGINMDESVRFTYTESFHNNSWYRFHYFGHQNKTLSFAY